MAAELKQLLPKITNQNLIFPHTEMVFLSKERLQTKEVDWLAWEDPFILGKDATQLKNEKEKDPLESEKRMSYVLPEIKYLLEQFRIDR